MCGIVGVLNASLYNSSIENFVKDGILVGAVRGMDSTGIIQVDNKDIIYTHKKAVPGPWFLADKLTKTYVDDSNRSPITIIHHRAATVGAVTKENAHPFTVNKLDIDAKTNKHEVVVGVHNGSLNVGWKSKPDGNLFDVDSQWALSHIAKRGNDAFKDIVGPYAFVWVDSTKPGKVHFARNSGRPLHLVFTKDRKQMYFASEAGMLSWLVERNRLVVEDEIIVVGTDRIYEFDTNGDVIKYTSVATPKVGGYTTVPPTNRVAVPATGTGTTSGNTTKLNHAGEKFIQGIKDALKPKPTPLTTEPEKVTIDQAAVDRVVSAIIGPPENDDTNEPLIISQRDDDSPNVNATNLMIDTDLVPTSWYSDRNATKEEKDLAQKLGFFRELQWFQGVIYDDQTGETVGDIEVWDKERGKQTVSATLRGVSRPRAHSQYIDNNVGNGITPGNWVVVIGAREEKQLGRVLVVAELNKRGEEGLAGMRTNRKVN